MSVFLNPAYTVIGRIKIFLSRHWQKLHRELWHCQVMKKCPGTDKPKTRRRRKPKPDKKTKLPYFFPLASVQGFFPNGYVQLTEVSRHRLLDLSLLLVPFVRPLVIAPRPPRSGRQPTDTSLLISSLFSSAGYSLLDGLRLGGNTSFPSPCLASSSHYPTQTLKNTNYNNNKDSGKTQTIYKTCRRRRTS